MTDLRIVSLLPSATEVAVALGFEQNLVGRSHECDFPPAVSDLPVCTATKLEKGLSSGAIDRRAIEQPCDRALTAPGDAVVHLLRLLGNVDVDGRLGVQRCEALHSSGQAVRRHGAQRVRRQAQHSPLRLCSGRKALQS